jgi:hypothetical protein
MEDLWKQHFGFNYPEYIRCMVGNDIAVISGSELKEFVKGVSGKKLEWREIGLYKGMVNALLRVYKWCKEKGIHEFTRQDIKNNILMSENDSARWGDWALFGNGMVYKPEGKGSWGLHMGRVEEFLRGERKIPTRLEKRGVEIRVLEEGTIKEIPDLLEYLDEDLKYLTRYREGSGGVENLKMF